MDNAGTAAPEWVVEMREKMKRGEDPAPEMVSLLGLPPCPFCGSVAKAIVAREDLALIEAWRKEGGPIQNYLPHWSADHREILLTGSHPQCFDEAFAEPLCVKCGIDHSMGTDNLCERCQPDYEEQNFCEKCGVEISEYDTFCQRCEALDTTPEWTI